MFIVIEGIDGAGKTTITKILSKRILALEYATPPKIFKERNEYINGFKNPNDRFKFFFESVVYASSEITNLLAQGASVVCDRYWMSTLVSHKLLGIPVDRSMFNHLLIPDLTVLLRVDSKEQLRRLNQRGLSANDTDSLGRFGAIAEGYDILFREEHFKNLVIQTESLDPEQITDTIERYISSMWGKIV